MGLLGDIVGGVESVADDVFRQHTAQLSRQFSQIANELGSAAGLAETLI